MTPPVDHSALIEQIEGWATRLNRIVPAFIDLPVVNGVIQEMRQVAADLSREDAEATK